jgi:peptidoglycan/LPS O-acetylase OafA/YrhL
MLFVLAIYQFPNSFAAQSINLETSLAASLVYMHQILLGGFPKLNPPAWSLEIELQFYVLAPIVLLAFIRLRLFGVIIAIVTLITGSIFASNLNGSPWHWVPLIDFFHLFLAGILVNVLILGGLVSQRIPFVGWDIGFVAAAIILYVDSKYTTSILTDTAQIVCYVILFLAAFEGKVFKRLLSQPYIFTIGGYVLHHLPDSPPDIAAIYWNCNADQRCHRLCAGCAHQRSGYASFLVCGISRVLFGYRKAMYESEVAAFGR